MGYRNKSGRAASCNIRLPENISRARGSASFCKAANQVASSKSFSYSGLPVVGLGGDEPLLADLVVGEIVDEHHVVDAHAHFGECLRR